MRLRAAFSCCQEIGREEFQLVEQVLDALVTRVAGPADDPEHLVAFLEQKFRQIGAVLAGDSSNKGRWH